MAFWKKSDDPWDLREEKEEPQNSFQQYVDRWNAIEEREKAEKEAEKKAREDYENAPFLTADAMDCPWCGRGMDRVYIMSSYGVSWHYKKPPAWRWDAWPLWDNKGASYKSAWYCPECQRMALDMKRPYDYWEKRGD